MARSRNKLDIPRRRSRNVSRPQSTFIDQIRAAGVRAQIAANQPSNNRSLRHIRATLAQQEMFLEMELGLGMRFLRWMVALVLLVPICFITTYTLIGQFSHEALHQRFWVTKEFWFFTIGSIIMCVLFKAGGWFRKAFLFLYVLGHEMTHAFFVLFHLGKVSDMRVSVDGGYIATNKSNILISLSPYFFPFWSVSLIAFYGILEWCMTLPSYADTAFYAMLGVTWTFHLWWTLWMIPRDQPDLKENDTFFSLVFIYLGNIIVLSVMLCAASRTLTFGGFFASWWVNAEHFLRITAEWIARF